MVFLNSTWKGGLEKGGGEGCELGKEGRRKRKRKGKEVFFFFLPSVLSASERVASPFSVGEIIMNEGIVDKKDMEFLKEKEKKRKEKKKKERKKRTEKKNSPLKKKK